MKSVSFPSWFSSRQREVMDLHKPALRPGQSLQVIKNLCPSYRVIYRQSLKQKGERFYTFP